MFKTIMSFLLTFKTIMSFLLTKKEEEAQFEKWLESQQEEGGDWVDGVYDGAHIRSSLEIIRVSVTFDREGGMKIGDLFRQVNPGELADLTRLTSIDSSDEKEKLARSVWILQDDGKTLLEQLVSTAETREGRIKVRYLDGYAIAEVENNNILYYLRGTMGDLHAAATAKKVTYVRGV